MTTHRTAQATSAACWGGGGMSVKAGSSSSSSDSSLKRKPKILPFVEPVTKLRCVFTSGKIYQCTNRGDENCVGGHFCCAEHIKQWQAGGCVIRASNY